jgi:hypothetical protein
MFGLRLRLRTTLVNHNGTFLDHGVMVNDLLTYKAHGTPGFDHTCIHTRIKLGKNLWEARNLE